MLQLRLPDPQARQLAHELGLDYVEDTCMGMERTLSQMVHGEYTPRCIVYRGIVPEAERPAALVAQRSNIAYDRRDGAAGRSAVANPARVRTSAPRSANRADAAADDRQAGRRRPATASH
ncbi:hypothetical protein OHA72_36440 [Dactylosporangium sp. NBC_01737]|uniref:hypothetical protein n=1 Tax=Dactylosporangium sp. NBC_01737 TaxID=2975959 RepID=UPI002E120C74|nr:hypothetical protein OHA72_36440 [Dactylosporangium sp. NBC_01737]